MEKKFAKAQAQLVSRAAILLEIGQARSLRTDSYPSIGCFTFELLIKKDICSSEYFSLEFDTRKNKEYNDDDLNAALLELDALITQAKKDARSALSLIEAWEK